MVLEVAYVLPTVQKPSDAFPNSAEEADYFVVVPPRSTWMDIGFNMIEEYIAKWAFVIDFSTYTLTTYTVPLYSQAALVIMLRFANIGCHSTKLEWYIVCFANIGIVTS